jgi:hypothetical protein
MAFNAYASYETLKRCQPLIPRIETSFVLGGQMAVNSMAQFTACVSSGNKFLAHSAMFLPFDGNYERKGKQTNEFCHLLGYSAM